MPTRSASRTDDLPALDVLRPILIGAVFLIDFTCFEGNEGSGSALDLAP